MTTVVGSGALTFEVADGWGTLPEGMSLKETPDVAVDSKDNVYAFSRGDHGVVVFDRDGNYLKAWGAEVFGNAHGICIGPDDAVYCVDNGDHTVRKFSIDGELLMTLGTKDKPSPRFSGDAFNLPTGLAVSNKTGDLFISDGYGNSRIHKYSGDGEHIMSWGEAGIGPSQFVIPHNICTDMDDNVYVADRECHRVQVFDANGKLQAMWNNIWKPSGIRVGADGNVYVAELIADAYYSDAPNFGHRVTVYDQSGNRVAVLGDNYWGEKPGQFVSPHGICLDSHGDVYVGEVSWTMMGRTLEPPREMRSLQKLVRKG